jgi:predicted XRE-type DNA-binding protein
MAKNNVFEQLGFSEIEAAAMKRKSDLLTEVVRVASRYRPAELEQILGESQPRVSNLLHGKIANFSLEKLIEYADKLDMQTQIKVSAPRKLKAAAFA